MLLRTLRRLLPVLPLLLGFVCLGLLDASEQTQAPAVVQTRSVAATRLVVIMVDSLDRRDVESEGSLPRLRARLKESRLHGPVLACVDAVTIPCVSAMITGFDRASGFSPLRNFGAARELATHSVLGALEQHGHRVGYFGDTLLARALEGLTMVEATTGDGPVDDASTLRRALESLAHDRLDLLFVHLLALDETAHKFTATSRAYADALARLDMQLDQTMRQLRADDHLVVLGDHGHAESGRHSAGLGMETYAAYFGPQFDRKIERELAMTDHARVWARLFGWRWGERSWVDGYFDGSSEGELRAASTSLAVRPRHLWPLLVALLLALAIAAAGADFSRARRQERVRVVAVLLGAGAMMALSLVLPWAWDWAASDVGAVALSLLLGLTGAFVLWLWPWQSAPEHGARVAPQRAGGLLVAGALLWALPTAEPTAGLKAPMLWLMAVLTVLFVRACRDAQRQPAARFALCLSALFVLARLRVHDYLPRALLATDGDALLGLFVPGLLIVAAVYAAADARAAGLATLGWLVAQLLTGDADRWSMVPCALILLLTFLAFRRAALFDAVCFLLPIACGAFFEHDSSQLAAVATTWLLWALLPASLRGESTLVRGATFVLLLWLSFWTAMSTRVGGVDYDFYFRWLPASAAATSDAVQQGLLTAVKCMLPAVFGALLARRAGALPLSVIKQAELLTRLRLALTIVFVVGISLGRGSADLYLLYDATQEVAFWLLMFATLGLVAAANQLGASSREQPASQIAR